MNAMKLLIAGVFLAIAVQWLDAHNENRASASAYEAGPFVREWKEGDEDCFTDSCVFALCEKEKGRPCSDDEVFGPPQVWIDCSDEETDEEELDPATCDLLPGGMACMPGRQS